MDRVTVLVIDDDPDWRTLLFDYLSADCDVVAIGEYASGIRIIADRSFDLVVLDLRLQDHVDDDSQGMMLLAAIRSQDQVKGRTTKVMVVSAYGTERQVREAFTQYSLDDYLEKQRFDRSAFVARVRQLTTEDTNS